jgi:hypothetical protein
MSLPEYLGAYEDCFSLYQRALDDPIGARACFTTESGAKTFQMRMHQARALDRRESMRIYTRDQPQWGKSEFDVLKVLSAQEDTEGNWWIYVQRHGVEIKVIESLSELGNDQ